MSVLIQRVPWRLQPQVAAAIDRGNPLAQGLVFLENAAVSNALTTGSPTLIAASKGKAFSTLSATNYRSRQQPIPITSAKEVTVIVVASATASTASQMLFSVGSSTNASSFFGIGTTSGATSGFWLRDSAATDQNVGTGSYDGVMRVYGGVCSNAGNRFEYWTSAGLAASAAATTKTTFTGLDRVGFGCLLRSSAGNGGLNPTIAMAAVWGRALSAKEMADVVFNPWQLFAPLPRTIWAPAAAGGTTYTITPSGGIVFSGTSDLPKGKIFLPTGGVNFAGTGSATFTGGGTTYTISPTGGITFAGTATQVLSKTIIPTGGFSFGGVGVDIETKVIIPSGGVTFGGTGSMSSNTSTTTGPQGERTKVGIGN